MNIIRYGCVNMTDWFRRSGTDYGFVKISKCLITIKVHVNIEQILTSHIATKITVKSYWTQNSQNKNITCRHL